jgi:tetratricopeptide (TPR) repeat protein
VTGAGYWYWHTSQPEYRVRRAQAALHAGDYAECEAAAEALHRAGWTNEALLLRGEALLQRGETRNHREDLLAALKLLNQIDGSSSVNTEAICLSGRCMLRLGNLAEAERAFAFVLSQDPDSVDAHRGMMAVSYDFGANEQARIHAEKWAELAPHDGRPHRFLGLLYKDLGDFREATVQYRAALERELADTVRQEVIFELAECHIRLAEHAAAREVLEASRPPARLAARALTAKAECERALGNLEVARELAARACAADGNYSSALRLRAQLALDAGDAAAAVGDLERAAALAPAEFETFHLLSQAYGQLHQPDKALRAQQRVTEIQGQFAELTRLTREAAQQPKDAKLHQRMATIYGQLGMSDLETAQRRLAAHLTEIAAPGVESPAPR